MLMMLVALLTGCAPSPASIKLEGEPTVTVYAKDPIALEKATVLDANNAPIEPQPAATFTVTPDTVAKLEGDKIVPVANGEATVTATLGELKAEYKLTVAIPDTIALTGYAAGDAFGIGETKQLTAAVKAGATDVPNQTIAWASDKSEIATVNESGLVTGVAAGTATISATSGALTQSVAVTIGAAAPAVADAAAPK